MNAARSTSPLRLVGLIELDPVPGDHSLIGTGFARLPREVRHTGGVTRLIGYEGVPSSSEPGEAAPEVVWQEQRVRFFGIEVEAIEDIPAGMYGIELGQTEWSIWTRSDDYDRVVWRGSTSWDWFSVSGNGRCIGEFDASCPSCSTRPQEWSLCESQPMRFSVFANAYIDTSRERFSDEVVLVDYDYEWPAKYRQMADWLERRLGSDVALRIEHYGSTAVPGLSAKPIIDILVEVPSFRVAKERVLPLLNDKSWEYWWYSDHMVLIKRSDLMGVRTHHVHLAPQQHAVWRGIAFRDYLRIHPEYALRYEDLKRRLAGSYVKDREAYTAAKTEFVQDITARALSSCW